MFPGSDGNENTGLTVVGAKELFERVYKTPGRVADFKSLDPLPFPPYKDGTMMGVAIRYESPDGKASSVEIVFQPWWMETQSGWKFDIMAPRKAVGKAVRNCQRDLIPEKELRKFEAFCVNHHSKHVKLLGPKDARSERDPRVAAMISWMHGTAASLYDKGKGEKLPEGVVVAYLEADLGKALSEVSFAEASTLRDKMQKAMAVLGREELRRVIEAAGGKR
jgi:hypothetical protein